MGFREIKQTSRRRLHDKMKVAANHYVAGNVLATPTLIYVRAHNKNVNQGDQAGTSLGFADAGAMVAALGFGWIARRFGERNARKRDFIRRRSAVK